MIANNPPFTEFASDLIDELWRDRLKSLLSVDDLIGALYDFLEDNNLLQNTYLYYSSDHGYHLGEFGVPCYKATPYEFDVRVPTYLMGPGIEPHSETPILVGNVDIYPTFMDLAGIWNGNDALMVDGQSFADLVVNVDEDSDEEMNW